jgi:hypothetical protein
MEPNNATSVNKEPFSLKKMFMRCNPFSNQAETSNNSISAIKLQIQVNEVKCCRKITLKGLYGENNKLQEFIN